MKNKILFYILLFLSLISITVCTAAEKDVQDKFIDMQKEKIDPGQFEEENNGVKFDSDINDVDNFEVTKNSAKRSVHVALTDESAEVSEQIIGVPLSDLRGFDGLVQVTHYREDGVSDYTQIIKPAVTDGVAYVAVEFTSVTVTPYISTVKNSGFEAWTQGENLTIDNWQLLTNEGSISNDSILGYSSYKITGTGDSTTGWIRQTTNYTAQNYTVGCWIKITGMSQGGAVIALSRSSPYSSITAINAWSNGDWTWYETTVNCPFANPEIHISGWNLNEGCEVYFDGLVVSPVYSYTATETSDATHLYQNFTFTPNLVGTPSTLVTKFQSVNLVSYNIASVTAKVDGVAKTTGMSREFVYVDTSGLSAAPHTVNITVTFIPLLTEASFSADTPQGAAPLTVHFTGSGTHNPTAWAWNFGDGAASTAQNPTHVYSAAGNYTVSLTVTNAGGTDTETKTNYIKTVVTPVTAFTWGRPGEYTYAFVDQSANSPAAWSWNFGDGATSTEQDTTHTYAGYGDFTVSLTTTNAAGTNSTTRTLNIAEIPKNIISPVGETWQHVAYNESREFSFTTPYGVLTSHWFIDGNEVNYTGLNLSYTFANPGRASNISVWAETTQGNSSMIEYRTMTGREIATGHVVPFNDTNYNNLMNGTLDMDTDKIMSSIFAPFTDIMGRMAYVVIFILPFMYMWLNQGKMTIPTSLALITGSLFIGYIPSQFTAFITIAIVLSFASAFYRLSRGP